MNRDLATPEECQALADAFFALKPSKRPTGFAEKLTDALAKMRRQPRRKSAQ